MSIDRDLPTLVDRLKRGGRLTSQELADIKQRLRSPREEELSQLARVLSLGAPPTRENIQLLEPWLNLSTEDWSLHGVIVSLCHDWKLTKNYLKPLLQIAQIENWESHESAVAWTLSVLGDYLSSDTDLDVLSHLFEQIEKASTLVQRDRSSKFRQYQNAVWYPIDRWQRGTEAIYPRLDFDPSSQAFKKAAERYRTLLL